jgi:hypothetical protein
MESVPLRWPLAVGVKVMEIAQAVDAASGLVQVLLLMAKSPVRMGVCSVAGLPPVLATVMIWAAVVWLTAVAGKGE